MTMQKNTVLALLLTATALVPRVAEAGCANSVSYCNPGGSGTDVCQSVYDSSAGEWVYECDVSGSSGGATVVAVTDYDTTIDDYEVWGDYGSSGGAFCCTTDVSGIDVLRIIGSDDADTLAFEYRSGANHYDLLPPGSAVLRGEILAGAQNDVVYGSYSTDTDYSEELYGEGGADTIHGNAGDDYISGGDGADTLNGGTNDDEIDGGAGDDIINGDNGDDTLNGDADVDKIAGAGGNDTIDGGAGGDFMCGDGGTADVIDDGDAVADGDKIWGADTGDTATCGWNDTQVDANSTATGCSSTTLTSRPIQCP